MAAAATAARADLPAVASLWIGGPLGWIAQLALQSFVARGHEVVLFHHETPVHFEADGIVHSSAAEVMDVGPMLSAGFSPAVVSDLFRLHLMAKTDLIWVDTDVLCYRPFALFDGYLVGYEEGGWINGAVLRLPKVSAALAELLECLNDPGFNPGWLHHTTRAKVEAQPRDLRLLEACRLIPNAIGPRALTYMLRKHKEDGHVLPFHMLNPLPWSMADAYFNPHGGVEGWLHEDTLAVHLYTSRIRGLHRRARPRKGSFIDRFADTVGFDIDRVPAFAEDGA